MRARSARSHHSSGISFAANPALKRPRSTTPSASSARRAGIGIFLIDCRASLPTPPHWSGRRDTAARAAVRRWRAARSQGTRPRCGRVDSRLARGAGMHRDRAPEAAPPQRPAAQRDRRPPIGAPAGATGRRESVDKRPARGVQLAFAKIADGHERIVQLVGAAGIGAHLVAHPIDGGRIERAEIVARRRPHPRRV